MARTSARIVRTDRSLTLYTGRVPLVVIVLVGALMLAAAVVTAIYDTGSSGTITIGYVLGFGFLAFAAWFGITEKPVLIVSDRGMCSPMFSQPEVIGWGRVARVGVGDAWSPGSLDVRVWKDAADRSRGTARGLYVPAGVFPVLPKRLAREIEAFRAIHGK